MKCYCRPEYDKGTLWYETEGWKNYHVPKKYKAVSRKVKHTKSGKKKQRQLAKKDMSHMTDL